ncbi:MAG: DUF1330 domain-containing protein [Methylobacter sp.]
MLATSNQVFIVATFWVQEGNVVAFEEYERKAARIMKKYGGSIERVIRFLPHSDKLNQPFEVHLVQFPSHEAFAGYQSDLEYKVLSSERDAAITKVVVHVGQESLAYAS